MAVNAQLLIRAGFVHKEMAGVYSFLPLGLRVLRKIEQIVREEMDKIGQEMLMPGLAPKKTWEGAVAGFLIALVAAGIFSQTAELELWHALILGILIGIVGQFSDLIESLIKRDAGVKDASSILPGHGGVLDRLDSLILTAPLMYYYVVWFVLK